jgi:hypothetical protein
MAKLQYGEVEWDSVQVGRGDGQGGSDFLALKEGSNKIRIISNPTQFYVHWVVDSTNSKRKVNCAVEECPVCFRGQETDRAQVRWMVKALDRVENKIKLLELGPQLFKAIKQYYNEPEWGDVRGYDLNIKRGPKGSNPLYTVLPGNKSPLQAAEKKLYEDFNARVDVERIVSPPTPEAILEKLGWQSNNTAKAAVSNDFGTKDKKTLDDFNFDD